MIDAQHFLKHCQSKPLTLAELKVGDKFIFFPDDGDDSGHGGFRGGARVFEKIKNKKPDRNPEIYNENYWENCIDDRGLTSSWAESNFVIKLHGIQFQSGHEGPD